METLYKKTGDEIVVTTVNTKTVEQMQREIKMLEDRKEITTSQYNRQIEQIDKKIAELTSAIK